MTRQKYPTRTIYLVGEAQKQTAQALIENAPLDAERPLEIVIREKQRTRSLDHNARMWAGPLRDIAEQAFVAGRSYNADTWHEHFKREFLPEEFNEELTREGYRKWDFTPTGERVLVGSTTQLTPKGFAQYLEQVIAFGAGLGVMFSAGREYR